MEIDFGDYQSVILEEIQLNICVFQMRFEKSFSFENEH